MKITCSPALLRGTVRAIPSKSDAHRKLICAAISENGGFLPLRVPHCDDILATMRCLTALGAEITQTESGVQIHPIKRQNHADLDCGESGSTLRFLLPVAMAVCSDISVTGAGRLPERPIGTLTDAMSAHGVQFAETVLPLSAKGALTGGVYEIAGNISSQFLSGLLMALPLCSGDSEIRLTTPLQSSAYVDMTLSTLREFGAEIITSTENGLLRYHIKGSQKLQCPDRMTVDGDWSNAAFWLTAGAILPDTELTVTGLSMDSVQGDKAIFTILQNAGARIAERENSVIVSCGTLCPFDAEMEAIPDLLPILAVRAAYADGVSHFVKAERLRLKESDRLKATADMLRSVGIRAEEHPDGLTVYGGQIRGGTVNGMNDHRMVMAAAIAALGADSPVTVTDAEAVNKSYPGFFADYRALGGDAE